MRKGWLSPQAPTWLLPWQRSNCHSAAMREQSSGRPRTCVSPRPRRRKALFACWKVTAARQGRVEVGRTGPPAAGENNLISTARWCTLVCLPRGHFSSAFGGLCYSWADLIGNAGWHSEKSSAPWFCSPVHIIKSLYHLPYIGFNPDYGSKSCYAECFLCTWRR